MERHSCIIDNSPYGGNNHIWEWDEKTNSWHRVQVVLPQRQTIEPLLVICHGLKLRIVLGGDKPLIQKTTHDHRH
jgi:hypothetical protein